MGLQFPISDFQGPGFTCGGPQGVEMRMQNWTRKIKAGLFIGLMLVSSGHFFESVSSPTRAPSEPAANPMQASSPDGLGVIEQACVQCHNLGLVFRQQKTEEAWEQTIAIMMWRGAQLLPGEAEMIQDYLVSDFGQNLTPSSSANSVDVDSALAEGPGKSLVAEACVGCHDLGPIVSERRSREEWQRIVQEMVRLGSPLGEGELETVIHYLSTSFTP